jgi:hypothetical protein
MAPSTVAKKAIFEEFFNETFFVFLSLPIYIIPFSKYSLSPTAL